MIELLTIALLGLSQVTQRVSVSTASAESNGSSFAGGVSADGRIVAFTSGATNLVTGDDNGQLDVFVRDRIQGTTELVSVSLTGLPANEMSSSPSISADGRFVVFTSFASDLVGGDTNLESDVFVRDRLAGTTQRASISTSGLEANDLCTGGVISADGRWVAFWSPAGTLVPADTNGAQDVFVRDLQAGTTERASVSATEAQANQWSAIPFVSADGRYVVFYSFASNLVPNDTNGVADVFVRDRLARGTERVSVSSSGVQGDQLSFPGSISADGRFVAFYSQAGNLVPNDLGGHADVFRRDRWFGFTRRISTSAGGVEGDAHSFSPRITPDGRFIAFQTLASNLVPGDTNGVEDIVVRDAVLGPIVRASLATDGSQASASCFEPAISADGRFVAFESSAADLDPADTNLWADVFVRDLAAAGFASLCDPGVAGVQACPCGNPASGAGRGCDNSSATGGARLSASGAAYLSTDSLVLSTDGERPTATSLVVQGDASAASGLVFGQGVRCAQGTLLRLYVRTAQGGSISVPGAGDPSVSGRSASLGDPIQAGESRWYFVYYRDPIVLGGCAAESTFNATQTGRIVWQL